MKLQRTKHPPTQCPWEKEEMSMRNPQKDSLRFRFLLYLLACSLTVFDGALSQQARMVIDGTLRTDVKLPSTTMIRILHEDSSVDRTVQFYDPQSYRFGVRLSSQDGFFENERILFRVVATAQDSFIARFSGAALLFRGTKEPASAPTTRVGLFRDALPTVYRSLRDTTVNEGQLLMYRFVAVDRDADTVRYSINNAPPGATIDPITGLFSWTPAFDQAETYNIRFLISDGFSTDNSHVSRVTVRNVNRPPKFASGLPDTTTREGDTLRFVLQATDPDGDSLLYTIAQAPKGMTIDSLSGAVRWVPTFEQAGNYLVRFLVTDGSLSSTSSIGRITVRNTDRPPVLLSIVSDTTIQENQELEYRLTASDPDGDSVWFSLKDAPEGLVLASSDLLEWKPSFTQAGEYKIAVTAHDQELSADAIMHVRVLNTDRLPGSAALYQPAENDTVRLVLSTPVRFVWGRSTDPDMGDTLRYALHIFGPKLDTTIRVQTDTSLLANIKPLLQRLSRYHWNVVVNDGVLSAASVDTFSFRTSEGITGSAELISLIPKEYDLEQSLPDPFDPMTTIRYALPERSYVKLTIFNMLGESLLVLAAGEKDAGVYDVTFDASDFTSGAYMYRLDAHPLAGNQTKDFVNTKKMFIVR